MYMHTGVIEMGKLPVVAQDAANAFAIQLPEGVTLGQAATNKSLVIIACIVSVYVRINTHTYTCKA